VFDIGIQELVIIFLVALLVFGPEKLPQVGRTLGRWMIEIRRGIQNAKMQMDEEFDQAEKKTDEEPGNAGRAEEGKTADIPDKEEKSSRGRDGEG
jgi:Tat protein translocase TatB subunit